MKTTPPIPRGSHGPRWPGATYMRNYRKAQRVAELRAFVPITRHRRFVDLAWAAGLFEGEGCFSSSTRSRRKSPYRGFSARVGMSDQDVVRRFAAILGYGSVDRVEPYVSTDKVIWQWRSTRFEHVQATIALLWQWLGVRRRARAKEILLLGRDYFSAGRHQMRRTWVSRKEVR